MIITTNDLSALQDEAHIDPEWMVLKDLDAEHECFAITLPHYTSLIPLYRAICLYLRDELADEMYADFLTEEYLDSPHVTIYWPRIQAPDLKFFKVVA